MKKVYLLHCNNTLVAIHKTKAGAEAKQKDYESMDIELYGRVDDYKILPLHLED